MSIERAVRIVCTDKGQHPERALVLLVPADDSRGFAAAESVTMIEPGHRRVTERAQVVITAAGTVHVPACPSCGRSPRIRAEHVGAVAATLPPDRSGRVVLDVSALSR